MLVLLPVGRISAVVKPALADASVVLTMPLLPGIARSGTNAPTFTSPGKVCVRCELLESRLETSRGQLANKRLGKHLRVLDVGNEWDGEINGHTASVVALASVARGAAIVVLRRQVDVHVDQVIRQMLRQRILRLLLVAAVLAFSKSFEVLQSKG